MDPQVYTQLQNLQVKLESVKNDVAPKAEHRDILVEAITTLNTILAIYTGPPEEDKPSLKDRFGIK